MSISSILLFFWISHLNNFAHISSNSWLSTPQQENGIKNLIGISQPVDKACSLWASLQAGLGGLLGWTTPGVIILQPFLVEWSEFPGSTLLIFCLEGNVLGARCREKTGSGERVVSIQHTLPTADKIQSLLLVHSSPPLSPTLV